MAIEVRLAKDDLATSWGFRLAGGANFELPLTTIKVVEGSIAEECGLDVGDVIVKINNDDITDLTHAQAYDKIVQAENELTFTLIRSEISDILRSIIKEDAEKISDNDESEEVENYLEGSVPIDYPEKTIDDLIKDSAAEAEAKKDHLPKHDLNLTDEEIHSIISPEIVTKKGKIEVKSPAKAKLELPQVLKPAAIEPAVFHGKEITIDNVKLMQSQVIQEINNNLREGANEGEKKWSTFLQKPQRAVPPSKPQFQVQKSSYKVKIRTKKDLEVERAAKQAALEAEALRQQQVAEQKTLSSANGLSADKQDTSDEDVSSDSSFTFSDSDNITEDTITFTSSGTEPTIEFTESLNSLESKLGKVKEQLQVQDVVAVPDDIQKLLSKIASQLEKIVKAVKPAVQNELQNGDATDDDENYDDFSDDESSSISFDSNISTPSLSTPSYEGTEPTLTFSSYSIMSDTPSLSIPEGTEPSLTFSDEHVDNAECDRTECDVTEMQEYQEEPAVDVQSAQADEKSHKKEKASKMEPTEPQEPMVRPIILPGGRKWCAPDDATRSATRRHPSLTDEKIDATISSYYEKIDGKTVGESNCCMVPSKVTETKKINFLKYQPPPKNLDHLKNSEVYKMVHNMGTDTDAGVFGRPEKVLSGQDYQKPNVQ